LDFSLLFLNYYAVMKNKIFVLLSLIALAVAGCSKKFLDEKRSFERYDESAFTNEVQTGWYIDRLYNYFFVTQRNPSGVLVGLHNEDRSRATEEFGGTINDLINPNKNLRLATEANTYLGNPPTASVVNNPYTRIRFANFLLEKMDAVGKDLPVTFRNTAKGQMYFLRALQYFDLVRVYGGVPIVLTVDDASSTDESIRVPRATSAECFAQIVKDLDTAASLLPMKWDAANYGRLSAAGALAMKSRVLLTAASPLYNTDWDNTGNERWQKALAAGLDAETKTLAAGYGASITNAKDWSEVTFKNDNAFNGEALMVQLLSSTITSSVGVNNNWENALRPKDHNGGGGVAAPKGMIDLFPLADGRRATPANGYVDTFFFENRDPRFYRTFAFSGAKWGIKTNANKVSWFYRWRPSATGAVVYYNANQVGSPVLVRKMTNPAADTTALTFSGTDVFEYRFAELLLNIAEAYAATGNTAKCTEYLGKIRQRVGIPAANSYGLGALASKYDAIEACLYERRVELAYEGKRFWDMQRWMLYENLATSGNTVSKLGLTPLNGTSRTAYYWQAKSFVNSDPLTPADRAISIDPDATPAIFAGEIAKLKAVYNAKLVMTPLDQPWDRDGSTPVNILFRPNYYLSGILGNVLATNPWLTQTTGWLDASGIEGSYQYR
jgi:hypothetical protein